MESYRRLTNLNFEVNIRCIFLFIFLLPLIILNATGQQKPTRQSSMASFSQGDFESAYVQFSELLLLYPKDPLYKYYSGVCLVKLERDPETSVRMLKEAKTGSSVVRNLPSDAAFWLGRAQQLAGYYDDAIVSFNEFTSANGRQAGRDLGVPALIQQCRDQKGALSVAELSRPAEPVKMIAITLPESPIRPDDEKIEIKEPPLTQFPDSIDKLIDEAFRYQNRADSISRKADEMENELSGLSYREKTDRRSEISLLREDASSFQKRADDIYEKVRLPLNYDTLKSEYSGKNESRLPAVSKMIPEVLTLVISDEKGNSDEVQNPRESVEKKPNPETSEEFEVKNENVSLKEVETVQKKLSREVYLFFEVLETGNEKIEINPSIPEGLIYRIQIAVFRNPVSPSYFRGITPVYGFTVPGTDRTAYYAGAFRKIADAKKSLTIVRQKGFNDAFIAAIMGGKTVSADRAALLEKEWGTKPLFVIESGNPLPPDTIPPELSFRVEVMKSQKPLKDDVLEGLKKAAGLRGLDTEKSSDGTIIYLIGRFITYDSASAFADLLIRNGYRETRVVARLGNKEIPVETARDLFEKID